MASKLPWLKWFPTDWLGDEKLRTRSVAARGVWLDLICLMHKSVRRGFLELAPGKPYTPEELARIVGCSVEEFSRWLQELLNADVFFVTADNVIFCRRMVQEEQLREKRAEAGAKGGRANADLLKQKSKQNSSKPPSNPLVYGSGSGSLEGISGGSGEERETVISGTPRDPDDNPAFWVGRVWEMHTRRTKFGCKQDTAEDAAPIMEVLLNAGFSADEIENAIKSRTDNTEYLWQFKQRLLDMKGQTGKGKPNRLTAKESVARRREKEAESA